MCITNLLYIKMRVFFDFYEIALDRGKSIGIYKYALAILNILGHDSDRLDIIVACNGDNVRDIKDIPNIRTEVVSKKYPNFIQRLLWRAYRALFLCKKNKIDIYYSPKGFTPVFKKRKTKPYIILTIHDMIPFYYLENYPKYFRWYERIFITKTLKSSSINANKIITISEYSKKMILKYAESCIESDINVIYNGITYPPAVEIKSEPSVVPYIFTITSNLPHKNKENILNGYIEYVKKERDPLRLKICGITEDDIDIPIFMRQYIDCLGFVNDDSFSALYSGATFFLFLPHIEGFGFPPFEALYLNKVSLVSDIPVLREVLKDAAFYINQNDPLAIADGIQNLISKKDILDKILKHRDSTLSQYTWEKCGEQIISIFEDTLNNINHDKS